MTGPLSQNRDDGPERTPKNPIFYGYCSQLGVHRGWSVGDAGDHYVQIIIVLNYPSYDNFYINKFTTMN